MRQRRSVFLLLDWQKITFYRGKTMMNSLSVLRCAVLLVALFLTDAVGFSLIGDWIGKDASQSRALIAQSVRRNPNLPPRSNATMSQSTLSQAQRFLKLGGTYREAKNYDLAQKYIQRGIELASKAGSPYWEATGYEYLGLVYRDMGDRQAALAALQRASDMFNRLIRQPDGSQVSTQALVDDVRRNDRSRPTPQATQARADLDRERALNKQLNERVASLEAKIRALEDRSAVSTGSLGGGARTTPLSESSPGSIAQAMPRQEPNGGKPQAEFSPYQVDKKVRPEAKPEPAPARATVMDVVTLPTFTLQIGAGVGFNLNIPALVREVAGLETVSTGGAPLLSFPLLSLSGDYFLTPNFSLGLMYGYYPGPDVVKSFSVLTETVKQTTITSYHLVALRPILYFVRERDVSVYSGLSLGTLIDFNPLRLYAGILAGAQYNFTRQVGIFLELSGGGTYTGSTEFSSPALDGSAELFDIGAYGRIGLAINF
jgi:tetratricopeptide (TPR) repeat protein